MRLQFLQFSFSLIIFRQKINTATLMRKLLKLTLLHTFCTKSQTRQTKLFNQMLYQNKTNTKFIKQNGRKIIHHMCDLIDNSQWKQLNNLTKSINFAVIDQWELWTQLSVYLNGMLKDVGKFRPEDVLVMLEVLYQLRYQPSIQQNPQLFEYVKNILDRQDGKNIRLASYFIPYAPTMFARYRGQYERIMQDQLRETGNLSYNNFGLFGFGAICNFWSKQFLNSTHQLISSQLAEKITAKTSRFIKYLELGNPDYPTLISQNIYETNSAPSKTQYKLQLMLADLGYMFDKNIYINGTEIDIYFDSCRMIVEYEGTIHYRINRNKGLISNIKFMEWKRQALKNRGFVLITLPFFDWNKLEGQKAQKLYLINRIQKILMYNYKPTPHK